MSDLDVITRGTDWLELEVLVRLDERDDDESCCQRRARASLAWHLGEHKLRVVWTASVEAKRFRITEIDDDSQWTRITEDHSIVLAGVGANNYSELKSFAEYAVADTLDRLVRKLQAAERDDDLSRWTPGNPWPIKTESMP